MNFYRRHPDSNWGIKDLQTSALPLGHATFVAFLRTFRGSKTRKKVLKMLLTIIACEVGKKTKNAMFGFPVHNKVMDRKAKHSIFS